MNCKECYCFPFCDGQICVYDSDDEVCNSYFESLKKDYPLFEINQQIPNFPNFANVKNLLGIPIKKL